MKELFEELIEGLGQAIGVSLKAIQGKSCTLLIEEKIKVHIEKRDRKEGYLLGSMLGSLPPGRYREEVLKNSLKENHISSKIGSLAYNAHNDQLVLFYFIEEDRIYPDELSQILTSFTKRALSWKESLEKNETGPALL